MNAISSLWLDRVYSVSKNIYDTQSLGAVNGQSTTAAAASNYNIQSSVIAPRQEIETVSQEIFKAAGQSSNVQNTQSATLNIQTLKPAENADVLKFYSENSKFTNETARTLVSNKAGLQINLSETAKSAVASLNANAIKYDAIVKIQDGRIVLPAEISNKADVKEVFAYENIVSLWNTDNLGKDKKGRNFFVMNNPKDRKNKEEEAGINLVA